MRRGASALFLLLVTAGVPSAASAQSEPQEPVIVVTPAPTVVPTPVPTPVLSRLEQRRVRAAVAEPTPAPTVAVLAATAEAPPEASPAASPVPSPSPAVDPAGALSADASPLPSAGTSPDQETTDVGLQIASDSPGLSRTVLLILLFALGSVAPAIILLMTSFTRFVVVLALTRNGLGLQGIPPTQVLIGLAAFMTLFTMRPVFSEVHTEAIKPALAGELKTSDALKKGFAPLETYMRSQTDTKDIEVFASISGAERGEKVPASTLIPAFVISELRRAFIIGFIIFIPFLIVDLVVSASLMSLGMVMVPPVVISLPLKLLLFVLVDGWGLVVRSVMASAAG